MKWAVLQHRYAEDDRHVEVERAHGPFDTEEEANDYGAEMIYEALGNEYDVVRLAAPVPRAKELGEPFEETAALIRSMITLFEAEKDRADKRGIHGPTDDDIKLLRYELDQAERLARAAELEVEG